MPQSSAAGTSGANTAPAQTPRPHDTPRGTQQDPKLAPKSHNRGTDGGTSFTSPNRFSSFTSPCCSGMEEAERGDTSARDPTFNHPGQWQARGCTNHASFVPVCVHLGKEAQLSHLPHCPGAGCGPARSVLGSPCS